MRARMLIFRSSMECDDCPQCLLTGVGSLMSHEGGGSVGSFVWRISL